MAAVARLAATGPCSAIAARAAHWGCCGPLDGPVDISVPSSARRRRRRARGIRLRSPHCSSADLDVIASARCRRSRSTTAGAGPSPTSRARSRRTGRGEPTGRRRSLGLRSAEIATDRTRSDLERDFLRLCRRDRLPVRRSTFASVAGPSTSSGAPSGRGRDRQLSPTSRRVAFEDDRARDLDLRRRGSRCAASRMPQVRRATRPHVAAGPCADAARRCRRIEWRRWPTTNSNELFLLDGNSLAYRAFFALPESIGTADGRPTNAIYGLASMLVKIIDEHHPRRRRRRLGRGDVRARGHLRPLQGAAQIRAPTCCASSGRT